MYSLIEREIIARCLSISIKSYKIDKLIYAERNKEAAIFMGKVRAEILNLERVIMNKDYLILDKEVETKKRRKISKLLGWFIGRDLQ